MIKKIRVKNFKSFRDIELSLGKVNILIGANGSGKSNFVNIFRFLREIAMYGLGNTLSMQGDIKYLKNVNINSFSNVYLGAIYDKEFRLKESEKVNLLEVDYSFILEISKDESEYKAEVKLSTPDGDMKTINFTPRNIATLDIDPELSKKYDFDPTEVLFMKTGIFDFVSIYDLNPKLSKMAPPIFAKADLEEDGKNLVPVINKILNNPEKKRMFLNLVTYLLPYIDDIKVDKFTETNLILKIKETYSEKHYLPAPLISDGTINALGLIVALYFQESPLIIIEEPDRGFHPSLISRVVNMIKDASRNKQIIVTTHNPVMVKHADPEDVFLVSRDKEGFSNIYKPIDKDEVKIFLENEMEFEELYENNLLEI